MPQYGTKQLDIRDQNVAVERVLAATENPRHRYLLQSYLRHRYLESAGRYQEIFAPEMTVEHPVYRFSLIGQPRFTLRGPPAGGGGLPALDADRPVRLLRARTRPWRSATI